MFSSASGLDAPVREPVNTASTLLAGNRNGSRGGQPRSSLARKYCVDDAKHRDLWAAFVKDDRPIDSQP
jgi:hypothetical protein